MRPPKAVAGMTLAQAMEGLPAEFGFFAERFESEVAPALFAREAERVAAARRQRLGLLAAALVGGALALSGFALFQSEIGLFAGLAAGAGIAFWGGLPLQKLGRETKLMLVEPVARQFAIAFTPDPPAPEEMGELRTLQLVPSWDRARYEDRLEGTRSATPFRFFEAHLEEKRTTSDGKGRTRTQWVTVFRGQCLSASFPKPFEGVTKVYRDAGVFNALMRMGKGGERVKLEDPRFEKAFEVVSTDQVEARFLLTPDFMERLLALEATFKGRKLRCAFAGGRMLVCVEGKSLFEPGSMHRPMADLARVREMLRDFAAVFLLIDAMVERRTPEALRAATD